MEWELTGRAFDSRSRDCRFKPPPPICSFWSLCYMSTLHKGSLSSFILMGEGNTLSVYITTVLVSSPSNPWPSEGNDLPMTVLVKDVHAELLHCLWIKDVWTSCPISTVLSQFEVIVGAPYTPLNSTGWILPYCVLKTKFKDDILSGWGWRREGWRVMVGMGSDTWCQSC